MAWQMAFLSHSQRENFTVMDVGESKKTIFLGKLV